MRDRSRRCRGNGAIRRSKARRTVNVHRGRARLGYPPDCRRIERDGDGVLRLSRNGSCSRCWSLGPAGSAGSSPSATIGVHERAEFGLKPSRNLTSGSRARPVMPTRRALEIRIWSSGSAVSMIAETGSAPKNSEHVYHVQQQILGGRSRLPRFPLSWPPCARRGSKPPSSPTARLAGYARRRPRPLLTRRSQTFRPGPRLVRPSHPACASTPRCEA
jgi:hypothetical protein